MRQSSESTHTAGDAATADSGFGEPVNLVVQLDPNRQAVIDRLRHFDGHIEALLSMLTTSPPRVGYRRADAAQRLRIFKQELRNEIQNLDRHRDALNYYEKVFLSPAVHKCQAHVRVQVTSIEYDRWHAELYRARYDIR